VLGALADRDDFFTSFVLAHAHVPSLRKRSACVTRTRYKELAPRQSLPIPTSENRKYATRIENQRYSYLHTACITSSMPQSGCHDTLHPGWSHWMTAPLAVLHTEHLIRFLSLFTSGTPEIGSMVSASSNDVSGTYIAHTICAQPPEEQGLTAPPGRGQRGHPKFRTPFSHALHVNCLSGVASMP
jgi:hypothetical protein